MYNNRSRYPRRYIINEGNGILKVPVDDKKQLYAIVEKRAWDELAELEFNPRLMMKKGHVCAFFVRPHRHYPLAYLIMDCIKGDLISYRDGDIFNLRRENLIVNHPIANVTRYRDMLGRGKFVSSMFSVDYEK